MAKKRFGDKGFSMVELLVVSTIIILLAAAGFVSFRSANRNARNAKRRSDLEQVRAALELYRIENAAYPVGSSFTNMITTLESGGFLTTSQNVVDPRNTGPYVYGYNDSSANCSGYELTGSLEPSATAYSLCNP